jgi:hypothetical protein
MNEHLAIHFFLLRIWHFKAIMRLFD